MCLIFFILWFVGGVIRVCWYVFTVNLNVSCLFVVKVEFSDKLYDVSRGRLEG